MLAYCYRDGNVHVKELDVAPEGAVELFRGPEVEVLDLVKVTTNDGVIPGMGDMESIDKDKGLLLEYRRHAEYRAGHSVEVTTITAEAISADREA